MRRLLLLVVALAAIPGAVGAQPARKPAPAPAVAETAEYYFLVARHYEKTGKVDEAVAALKRAIDLEPSSAEVRAELAALYAREDRAVEALNAAEDALKYGADNPEANRVVGTIYAALSEQRRALRPGDDPTQYLPRAIAALEKARGATVDLGLEFMLGRLYGRAGRHKDAIVALNRVFEQQPEYTEGGMLLAASQEAEGRVADATTTIERVVEANPTFFRGHVRLIELYERQRRWKEAAAAYAAAQEANPRADLTAGRAAALMNSGEEREAQAVITAALSARKTPDAALLYLLAESQFRAADTAGAAATAAKLRIAFPDDPRALIVDAKLHLAAGRKKEALAAFGELVKRVPNEASFVYQYAQLLQDVGRFADAERALRDVIAKDPDDANALNSLGYMFAERGERLEEAVDLLQRALKIEPGNPSFLDSLGWAYFKQNRLELADAPLSDAASQMPKNSVIQDHLGDLRFRQQRFSDAVAAWERSLAGDMASVDKAAIEKKLRDARSRVPK